MMEEDIKRLERRFNAHVRQRTLAAALDPDLANLTRLFDEAIESCDIMAATAMIELAVKRLDRQ